MITYWPLILLGIYIVGSVFVMAKQSQIKTSLGPIIKQQTPPFGLGPILVGTLFDNKVHPRDVASLVVDLAIKGYIVIEERQMDRFLYRGDFVLHRTQKACRDMSLPVYEQDFICQLFADKEAISLMELNVGMQKYISRIPKSVVHQLVSQGYYTVSPTRFRLNAVVWGIFTFALFLGVGSMLEFWRIYTINNVMYFCGAVSVLMVMITYARTQPLTRKGFQGRHHIYGFKEFLSTPLQRPLQDPDYFYSYIGHALSLNVLHEWARIFRGMKLQNIPFYMVHPEEKPILDPMMLASRIESFVRSFMSFSFKSFKKSEKFSNMAKQVYEEQYSEQETRQ